MVVRSNVGNFYAMKKGIAEILFHCSEHYVGKGKDKRIDNEKRHQFCPRSENSWCKFQKDKITGEPTYKAKINIPEAVRDVLMPIFSYEDLASDKPLKKCLHGQKVPKDIFVCMKTLQMGVASAVIHYNDGGRGVLKVIEKYGFVPGHFAVIGYAKYDNSRVNRMNKKMLPLSKQRRKKLRAERKGYEDKNSMDGKSYDPGNC